jgi:glycosyltransferase involved in cell wall biosynthesis
MRPQRIDLVSEHASPLATLGGADAGGQNVHVAALATELGQLGCEVTVLTRRDSREAPKRVPFGPRVVVEHVDAGPPEPVARDDMFRYMPTFALRVRRRWRAEPPDLVHAHFWMSGWAAAQAGLPVPLVQTFHALGVVKRRHQRGADTSPAPRQRIEAALLHRIDHVVATCRDEVSELVAMGADAGRVSVVPCGVDLDRFTATGPVAPREDGLRRIVVVSRLVPRKGIEDVIRALTHLPDAELLVAGGPPEPRVAGDPEVRRLQGVAANCGVASRVRFLGGLRRDEVPPLIRSADVVACVPWYEPFGIVPVEAMACGVPVVGAAVGGLLDTVLHGRSGLLVPPREPSAIAEAIGHLLANPSLCRRMGQEGAARARQFYGWRQVAHSTLEVYEHVLDRADGQADQTGMARPQPWAVPA